MQRNSRVDAPSIAARKGLFEDATPRESSGAPAGLAARTPIGGSAGADSGTVVLSARAFTALLADVADIKQMLKATPRSQNLKSGFFDSPMAA